MALRYLAFDPLELVFQPGYFDDVRGPAADTLKVGEQIEIHVCPDQPPVGVRRGRKPDQLDGLAANLFMASREPDARGVVIATEPSVDVRRV